MSELTAPYDDSYDESTRKSDNKKSGRKFNESTSTEVEIEVFDKWERMSDEIKLALNFEPVARKVAKKYFPRHADKIARWLNHYIDLIWTDDRVEEWTEMDNCLRYFINDNGIQISDLA